MAERLKAVASKAIVRLADRGFESLSLRHSTHNFLMRVENYLSFDRFRIPSIVEGLVAGHDSKSERHESRRRRDRRAPLTGSV